MLFWAVVGSTGAVWATLSPIQTMSFYQRTGRGDSNTSMGGQPEDDPRQGLCRGNGAAPACWLMMCSAIMACYKKSGFGSSITSPMSRDAIKFMVEIYVDDSDLLVCLAEALNLETVVEEAQCSLNAWAQLLNATGGALNPNKCYWYAVHYICISGEWAYGLRSECTLTIPLPDGS
jgi:hypothetical protein